MVKDLGWENPETTYNTLISKLRDTGFVLSDKKGNIHDSSSILFMQNIIGAEGWVLNLLKSGVRLDFSQQLPSSYSEPNNKSAIKELDFLREKTEAWIKDGFVQQVDIKPLYINPMSVVVKLDLNSNSVKKRPVIDMSRCINKKLYKRPFSMDTLSSIEPSLQRNDYQVIFDLENMYFHFKLAEEHQHYFSFSLPDKDGKPLYFKFLVMCYGYSLAAYIVTRVIVPIKAFLHKLGIRFSIYIDDGRVLAQTRVECEYKAKFALHIFQLCGFNIQWKKTNLEPLQVALYQGFITDTRVMRYFCSLDKFALTHSLINETIFKIDNKISISVRELATLLGKLHSLSRSHGSIVSIMTRHVQHVVGKQVYKEGWESSMILDEQCKRELKFLEDHLIEFNGKLIPISKTGDRTIVHEEIDRKIQKICYTDSIVKDLVVSDASDKHAFVYKNDDFTEIHDFEFDDVETTLASGHRELLAVLKYLEECKKCNKSFSSNLVYWQTDSKNNFIFLSRGSRQPRIQKDVVSVKLLERDLGVSIIPVWTPRSHSRIVMADLGSKFSHSSDEWGIDRDILFNIFKKFESYPDVDCFASAENFVCKTYFSKIPQKDCSGINFFSQRLTSQFTYFCCPPVKEVENTLKHLISTANVSSVLVIPYWNSAHYWPLLHNGQSFIPQIVKFLVFNPRFLVFNQCDSIFARKPTFEMIALKIKS